MTTRSTATRRPTPATTSRRSSATPTGRRRRRRRRSTSRPASCSAASPGELGLRKFLEEGGHELVVTSDKDGADSVFERELPDADVVISQPFWPAYLTAERIAKAPNLKLAITAGHRLRPRRPRGRDRHGHDGRRGDLLQQHQRRRARRDDDPRRWCATTSRRTSGSSKGGWNIADCVSRSYDVEGMQVGTVAAGRIGTAVLRRLKPFEVGLHYTDRHRLPDEVERELGLTFHADASRHGARVRRRDDQRAAAPGDRGPVRRRADRQDEARRLPGEHRARQDLRPRRRRAGARERPAGRVRRRRLVSPARAERPPVALDAPPRHDAAHLRARACRRRRATPPARARSSSASSTSGRSARST